MDITLLILWLGSLVVIGALCYLQGRKDGVRKIVVEHRIVDVSPELRESLFAEVTRNEFASWRDIDV